MKYRQNEHCQPIAYPVSSGLLLDHLNKDTSGVFVLPQKVSESQGYFQVMIFLQMIYTAEAIPKVPRSPEWPYRLMELRAININIDDVT